MKVITSPTVYVLGRQEVDAAELDRFLADHGVAWESDSEIAAEVLCETAGRCCYMSYAKPRPGGNAAYLRHIKESGHGSVLEAAVWNLMVTGVSRSLTHELIRHRAGVGVSQLSQRYVDESVAEYVEPAAIASDPELHAIWLDAVEHAHAAYVVLADKLNARACERASVCKNCDGVGQGEGHKGWWICSICDGSGRIAELPAKSTTEMRKAARQAARSVLPNATETKIFLTLNARAARNIVEQRGSRHAEPEIRRLANALLGVLQKESPALFGDYTREALPDGTCEIKTPYRKV